MKNWRAIKLETILKNSKYIHPTNKNIIGIRRGKKISAYHPIIDVWGYDAEWGIVKVASVLNVEKRLEIYANESLLVTILEGDHLQVNKYNMEAEVIPGIMLAIRRKNKVDIYCTDTLGATVIDGGETFKQYPRKQPKLDYMYI